MNHSFTQSRWCSWTFLCVVACLSGTVARADTIAIGVLSFDNFIPSSLHTPGVNAFNISNFTGVFALPPDFPVADDLTLQGIQLMLVQSVSPQELFNLGDIGPGFLLDVDGNPVVQVADNQLFSSAELTATLSSGSFMLADGSTFVADSPLIDILLTPSSGTSLRAGNDFAIITVSGSPASASTPEPASAALLLSGLLGLIVLRKRALERAADL